MHGFELVLKYGDVTSDSLIMRLHHRTSTNANTLFQPVLKAIMAILTFSSGQIYPFSAASK